MNCGRHAKHLTPTVSRSKTGWNCGACSSRTIRWSVTVTMVVKDFRPAGLAGQYLPKDMVFKVPEDLKMWVKRPAGHYYLPLMFNVSAGITVNILRYPNPGVIGRHVHEGPVFSYTIDGAWYYPEHDWVAEAGNFIWESPEIGRAHACTHATNAQLL